MMVTKKGIVAFAPMNVFLELIGQHLPTRFIRMERPEVDIYLGCLLSHKICY